MVLNSSRWFRRQIECVSREITRGLFTRFWTIRRNVWRIFFVSSSSTGVLYKGMNCKLDTTIIAELPNLSPLARRCSAWFRRLTSWFRRLNTVGSLSLALTLWVPTLIHSHSLWPTYSLPLTLTHAHLLIFTHSHSRSLTHAHSLSLTLTHAHLLTLTHSHSLVLTLTHSRSLSLTLTHSLSLTLTDRT